MANPNLQTYKTKHIIVDGDPLVINGIQLPIAQRIVYTGFGYNEDISGIISDGLAQNPVTPLLPGMPYLPGTLKGNTIDVRVRVLFYKLNPDGTRGERMVPTPSLPEYDFTFKANETTLVDDATGDYVGTLGEEEMEEHTRPASYDAEGNLILPAGKLYGKKFIREIEFFDRMGDLQYQPGVRHILEDYITRNKSRVQPYR